MRAKNKVFPLHNFLANELRADFSMANLLF